MTINQRLLLVLPDNLIKRYLLFDRILRNYHRNNIWDNLLNPLGGFTEINDLVIDAKILSLNDEILRTLRCNDSNFIENSIYSKHPYDSNYFLRISDFHSVLLQEKSAEFIKLMTSLGAKRIYIKYEETESREINVDTGVIEPTSSINADFEIKKLNESKKYLKIEEIQDIPEYLPKIPSSLQWLQYEPLWQSVVNGRLNGNWKKSCFAKFQYTNNFNITSELAIKFANIGLSIGGTFSEMKTTMTDYYIEFFSREEYEARGIK